MRKWRTIAVSMLSLALLAGCSGSKPESTVEEFFTAGQQLDTEAMAAAAGSVSSCFAALRRLATVESGFSPLQQANTASDSIDSAIVLHFLLRLLLQFSNCDPKYPSI